MSTTPPMIGTPWHQQMDAHPAAMRQALDEEYAEAVDGVRAEARAALTELQHALAGLNRTRAEFERLYDVEVVEGRTRIVLDYALTQAENAMAMIDLALPPKPGA